MSYQHEGYFLGNNDSKKKEKEPKMSEEEIIDKFLENRNCDNCHHLDPCGNGGGCNLDVAEGVDYNGGYIKNVDEFYCSKFNPKESEEG